MDIKSPCLDNIVNGGRTGTFQKIWGLSGSFPPDRQYQDKNLVLEDIFLLIVEFSYSQERNKVWSLAEGHKKGGELGIQCFGKGPARFLMRGIPIPLSRAVNFEIPCALWTKHRERERETFTAEVGGDPLFLENPKHGIPSSYIPGSCGFC